MIKIYQKNIKNKGFYYLTEQIYVGDKYKKIQVYLGKNIPKNIAPFYKKLQEKEVELILEKLKDIFTLPEQAKWEQIAKVEKARLEQKYFFVQLSPAKLEKFWRRFAIEFIFQSNAIEGSKLSREEVEKIINKKYLKKSLDRKEVIEVQNSLRAFQFVRSDNFKLNQKNIKKLHQIITANLGVEQGYKKQKIIVNNKETVSPKLVKRNLQELIVDYKKNNKQRHKFFSALDFHSRFEFIHPFADGNGRTGRMLLIYMLQKSGYGVILFKLKNRIKYFNSLNYADEGRKKKWYWFAVNTYKQTNNFLRN